MDNQIVLEQLDISEALRYLGYGSNLPDEGVMQLINECTKEIMKTARPQMVYKVFNIEAPLYDQPAETVRSEAQSLLQPTDTGSSDVISEESASLKHEAVDRCVILSGTNLVLTGNSITEHLSGCEKAVLFAATISADIDKLIRVTQLEDMAKAVITDSLASVAVEQVCDKTELIIKEQFLEYYQTFRFGVGYGDLPITLQKDFVNVLNAPKVIGLNVGTSYMLTPAKSVTAVIGLSKQPISRRNRGCRTCNMYENCNFRRKGGRCNE